MNEILKAVILSMLPVSELRGGIPVAIMAGINPIVAFFIGVAANIIIIPIIFFFLDYLHKYFLKISIYRKLFDLYVRRLRRIAEIKIKALEFLALYLFVFIPAPGTGAYTGCLIAWIFGLERKKSMIVIALGVLTAGVIVTLVSLGIVHFL